MSSNFLLNWEHINVTVKEKRYRFFRTTERSKCILNDVSGSATSHSLVAILGPSGSGKTTFLGAISGRIKEKNGIVKINNKEVSNKDLTNISGYMKQDNVFTESLTVYECMKFTTSLKLHKTAKQREMKIKKLLNDLSLDENKDTIINALSGGEKRRLSLATELIDDPYILFCDEPTTGLDSYSAMTVVQTLESIALSGKLILLTLHQPSSEIFDLFSNIILLANGELIFGGTKAQCTTFFESADLYCPISFNKADFYIKCLTGTSDEEEKCKKEIYRLRNFYKNSFQKINNVTNDFCLIDFSEKRQKMFLIQLKWLIWRNFINSRRNMQRFLIIYLLLTVTALIISVCFSTVTLEKPSSGQSIQGVLSLMISELIFTCMYYVIYDFPCEFHCFIWEKSLYSSFPYFISKLISTVPICVIYSGSFLLVYFIILQFLNGIDLFLNMFVVLIFTSFCGISVGFCLSALFSSVEYIDLIIVPIELILMTLSGIWIKVDNLPKMFVVLKYFSPFYFGFQSVSTLQWENIINSSNCTNGYARPCYDSVDEVLKTYGLYVEYDIFTYNIVILIILNFLYCFVGYLGIIRKRSLYELY